MWCSIHDQLSSQMLKSNRIIFWISFITTLEKCYANEIPEIDWRTEKIIESYGYPVEVHQVVTADDYIIQIHRIPAKNKSQKYPVLMQHGLWLYSSSFVSAPSNISLGYTLSDAGYDVWLGNLRGTPHSSHKTLTRKSEKFWNYTLEDIALYDLPAMIDYVLNVTKHPKLYYIGHSMGTTVGFILLSTKTEYNNKIKLFIAESPSAYLHNMPSFILKFLVRLVLMIVDPIRFFYIYSVPPIGIKWLRFCSRLESCLLIPMLENIIGKNRKEWNWEILVHLLDNFATPFSTRIFQHYAQIVTSQKFQRFDWGMSGNMITYGQEEPPAYNLEAIGTPTVFFCGLNDQITSIADAKLIIARLSDHLKTFVVEDDEWTHVDFLIATNVYDKVNRHIIQTIDFFV